MRQKTKESRKKVIKAAGWYTISSILLRGISFFTVPIFTRILTTSDYGIASNFTSWTNILFCISGLGLGTAVIRGKVEFQDQYKEYLSSIQFMGMLFTAVLSFCLFPLLPILSRVMGLDKIWIILMLLYLIFYPSIGYMQTSCRFEYEYKQNVWISVVSTLGTVAGSVLFIFSFSSQKYAGRILGSILPGFLMGLIFGIKIFRRGKCFINKYYWRYALKISLPMIPHSLAMIVLGQIDRVMLMKYSGSSAVGIYSFIYTYGSILSVVMNALNEAIQPLIYESLEKKSDERVNEIVKKSNGLMAGLALATIGVGPEIIKVLGTEEYFAGRWIIPPIVLGTLFQFFYQNFACVEIYHKKTKIIAVGSIIASVVNIILNALFIPRFGYIAAAYTTLAGYFLLMIFHFLGARKAAQKRIYSGKSVAFITILCLLCECLLTMTYDFAICRYALLTGLAGFILYHGREQLNEIIVYIKEKKHET